MGILLELALKHMVDSNKYLFELRGEKAFDFRMRLKDRTHYLEFEHWCGQRANILHRLKYITNVMVTNLSKIKPTLVDIRIPDVDNYGEDDDEHGLVFSEYEQNMHTQYVQQTSKLSEVKMFKQAKYKNRDSK